MNKFMLAAVLVVSAAGTAGAGGQEGSIGVGAEYGLAFTPGVATAGLGFASMNYDAGAFHVGGVLGFSDGGNNNDTNYGIGARFYYHLHSTAMADFGLGGALVLLSLDNPMMANDRQSLMFLEPGLQIRLFLASNVALSFTTGLTIGLIDADGFAIGGQPTGSAGIHYYFF